MLSLPVHVRHEIRKPRIRQYGEPLSSLVPLRMKYILWREEGRDRFTPAKYHGPPRQLVDDVDAEFSELQTTEQLYFGVYLVCGGEGNRACRNVDIKCSQGNLRRYTKLREVGLASRPLLFEMLCQCIQRICKSGHGLSTPTRTNLL